MSFSRDEEVSINNRAFPICRVLKPLYSHPRRNARTRTWPPRSPWTSTLDRPPFQIQNGQNPPHYHYFTYLTPSQQIEPSYQELGPSEIPTAYPEGPDGPVRVKVISGKSFGVESPVRPLGGSWYFHFIFDKKSAVFQELRKSRQAVFVAKMS